MFDKQKDSLRNMGIANNAEMKESIASLKAQNAQMKLKMATSDAKNEKY